MGFKLKSGNTTVFKMMGSSPMALNNDEVPTGEELTEAEKQAAIDNAMPEAEVAGRFEQNQKLEREMKLAKGEVAIVNRSRFATREQKDRELSIAQGKVDDFVARTRSYWEDKARHASHVKEE